MPKYRTVTYWRHASESDGAAIRRIDKEGVVHITLNRKKNWTISSTPAQDLFDLKGQTQIQISYYEAKKKFPLAFPFKDNILCQPRPLYPNV